MATSGAWSSSNLPILSRFVCHRMDGNGGLPHIKSSLVAESPVVSTVIKARAGSEPSDVGRGKHLDKEPGASA
ncbi:hypothetical protein QIS74_05057 [Colletotrichum tabaci]|uniref:Uncharacterized protein n=1 Tax=Colletotrichum tabaci TaxID=1209068 RepID=A0AAV9TH53_9PEZI